MRVDSSAAVRPDSISAARWGSAPSSTSGSIRSNVAPSQPTSRTRRRAARPRRRRAPPRITAASRTFMIRAMGHSVDGCRARRFDETGLAPLIPARRLVDPRTMRASTAPPRAPRRADRLRRRSAAAVARIVLISLDTVRADNLSSQGAAADATPNLDRFAAVADRYEEASRRRRGPSPATRPCSRVSSRSSTERSTFMPGHGHPGDNVFALHPLRGAGGDPEGARVRDRRDRRELDLPAARPRPRAGVRSLGRAARARAAG